MAARFIIKTRNLHVHFFEKSFKIEEHHHTIWTGRTIDYAEATKIADMLQDILEMGNKNIQAKKLPDFIPSVRSEAQYTPFKSPGTHVYCLTCKQWSRYIGRKRLWTAPICEHCKSTKIQLHSTRTIPLPDELFEI